MAFARVRTHIANPRRRRSTKRNRGRKNLSAKQIRFFGTPEQKAALKRSRAAKRAANARKNSAARKHRKRTRPVARRTNKARRVRRASVRRHNARRRTRRNSGAIVHYTLGSALGNPAKKEGKMARTRRRKNRSHAHRSHRRTRANRRRSNGMYTRRRRRNTARHYSRRRRSNPFGGSWGGEIMNAAVALGGFVASKLGAQAVLGSGNTGPMGYAATIAVGGVGAWAIGGPLKNKKAAASFFTGSVIAVVAKIIQDYTPLGAYLQSAGLGDGTAVGFGAYMPSNWLTPQIYQSPTTSAMVKYPWGGTGAPTAVVASAAPPPDMQASSGMGSLYGAVGAGGGLY